MSTVLEKFPNRGDTVTLQCEERRFTPHDGEIDPLIYEVDVLVTKVYPEESLVMGVELHRFCYVKGFRDKGRKLPPMNPYGSPKTNGYVVNCSSSGQVPPVLSGTWRCLQ